MRFLLAGAVISLGLALSACSQSPTPADPYAGGQSYPWEASQTTLQTLSLDPGVNTLQFETPTYARSGWGPIEKNTSNGEQQAGDGHAITLNGKTYTQGYGVHASSELRFNLTGSGGAKCNNFTSDIGVDDEVGNRGSVTFQVFADNVKLYDSGVMTGSSATKRVNVRVAGRQELRLVVTDAGNGLSYDHADWADPKITCATTLPKPGSVDGSWGTLPANLDPTFPTALLAPDNSVLTGGISVLQPDGKLVKVTNLDGGKFELRRYNPDGSPDTSFGTNGRVTTDFGPSDQYESGAAEAQLQPDGKILVVGGAHGASNNSDFALARYNPNGSLDTTFGTGGVVYTDFAPFTGNPYPDQPLTSYEVAEHAQFGPNGTIVVIGRYTNSFGDRVAGVIARYKANGTLDSSLGGQGVLFLGDATGGPSSLMVEPNGDIVRAGDGRATAYVGVFVDRIPGGDTGNFFMGFEEGPNGTTHLARQADGKILVAGYNAADSGPYDGVVVRLNHDLSFDTTFGTGGQVVLKDFGAVQRVLVQADGKIVAVGDQIVRLWP